MDWRKFQSGFAHVEFICDRDLQQQNVPLVIWVGWVMVLAGRFLLFFDFTLALSLGFFLLNNQTKAVMLAITKQISKHKHDKWMYDSKTQQLEIQRDTKWWHGMSSYNAIKTYFIAEWKHVNDAVSALNWTIAQSKNTKHSMGGAIQPTLQVRYVLWQNII